MPIRGNVQKKKQYIYRHYPNWGWPPSLLPYFWQIYFWHSVDHVDLPPSPRIFDKNHEILGFETYIATIHSPQNFGISLLEVCTSLPWLPRSRGVIIVRHFLRNIIKEYMHMSKWDLFSGQAVPDTLCRYQCI